MRNGKKTVIIGAGPAGLAAGYWLANSGVNAVILEKDPQVGGISRTICYKGYYFDIGGHRFYTKNKRVLSWWQELLSDDFRKVSRSSRIYYQQAFFDYPLTIANVIAKIGFIESALILLSYIRSRVFRMRDESCYEQWLINRFGRKLYRTFFKEYTLKVWGLEPGRLSSDVGAQRIKGLSLSEAARNAFSQGRGNTIKTLIKEFYFPRLGAGMMYEAASKQIAQKGGQIILNSEVVSIRHDHSKISAVIYKEADTGKIIEVQGSDFCSSMPLTHLAALMDPAPSRDILDACLNLRYRSLVMVNCILARKESSADNWIYINSSDVKVARIQNFKNWSADMIPDLEKTSLGLEYFCDEGDEIWSMSDKALMTLAGSELEQLNLCCRKEILDGFVMRVAKTYPIYEKGYVRHLSVIKEFLGKFSNLHCMGRYGMFRYNGMDHSILTGFLAAENVLGKCHDLWSVNAEAWDD